MGHEHTTHDAHCGHHDHGGHGMGHGDAATYLKRFWIVMGLLVPLVLLHPAVWQWFGFFVFPGQAIVQFCITTVIFGFALVFFEHAWHEIKARAYGMMTLVSLAVGSGYLFSAAATFVPAIETQFYLEISTLIWVLLFGHYLEAKSGAAAGSALDEVVKLLPKEAHLVRGDATEEVPVTELKEGDKVVVKPGEKVPADGMILHGGANMDEALVSGESTPIHKAVGDEVVAGSICLDGSITVELKRVGEHSMVGQIEALIKQAGTTKPSSQRLADRAAAWLTLVSVVTALLTLVVWTFFIGEGFVFAATLAITVLVITCPHALGLAIPTVTTITTSLAVKNGFFIKDLSKIETIRRADYVVFDKTGTLTEGVFGVDTIVSKTDGVNEDEILRIAASIEQHSSHIIGSAIVKKATQQGLTFGSIDDFTNVAGKGIEATIDGTVYILGNEALVRDHGLSIEIPSETTGTVVVLADSERVLGYLILRDTIKDTAHEAVHALHGMGVKVAMLTGDNEAVARTVADELGIDTYFAGVLPEDKYTHIKELQQDGSIVLMVGDGVNDAPALTQANAGVAIGAGTDVAVEAGDIVLTDDDPRDVVKLLQLSRVVYRKMIQNLIWALGYNIVAIPAAAGVFAAWGFFVRPEVGALVMSLSTVIVVTNALTLRRIDLS